MRCRVSFLLKTYLWTVLVFIVAKPVFMLACREGHVFTATDVWQVVRHGLSLDLSTALYFLILPFLVAVVSVWWQHRVKECILKAYFLLSSVAFALAFVADASLYPFWGFKLDASCLQYLTSPTEAMASVSAGYLLWRLGALVTATLLIFLGYQLLLRHQLKLICAPNLVDLRTKLSEFALYVLMIPVIVIGIRGGLDESTTNIGQVYYSQNQFLNHSAVNPVFSFLSSFEKTAGDIVTYDYMTAEACERLTSPLFNTESLDCDTLLNTRRPNIVVILLESCGGEFTEIGGRSDIMPNLNRFSHEGIYFSNCYANSWRTDRGTLCTWSGYPSFPTMSVMKMPAKTRLLPSLAKTLQGEGYQTTYLYGGDINFTNMRSYLVSTGFERLIWKADYTSDEQRTAQWGVRDDLTFQTLVQEIRQQQAPFLIGYSTLSSHEPWDVPGHHFDDPVLNAFYYLDECIGRFVAEVQKTETWNDLLIVMLPDHGIPYRDIDNSSPLKNHIPMLWLGGAVREPRVVDIICNQTDLPATLLGQMGLVHDDFPYSRDVLSTTYRYPVAYHTYRNGYALADSTGYMVYDLDSDRRLVGEGAGADNLEQLGKALLQKTSTDLKNMQ